MLNDQNQNTIMNQNKKQTAVEWLIYSLDSLEQKNIDNEITLCDYIDQKNNLQEQAKAMEQEQSVICKDCGEIITAEQINNHLFMKMEGGGLIHWKC